MKLSVSFMRIKAFRNPPEMKYYSVFMKWKTCMIFLSLKHVIKKTDKLSGIVP